MNISKDNIEIPSSEVTKEDLNIAREEIFSLDPNQIVQLVAAKNADNKRKDDEIEFLRATSGMDELTNLPNRKGFNERFNSLVKSLDRSISTLKETGKLSDPKTLGYQGGTILFLDLVGLKSVNDNQGYEHGDNLLIKASDVIKKSKREDDIASRWGGDEFIIFLPNIKEEGATELVRRLQENMKGLKELTFSIGIAEFSYTFNINDAINRASEGMEDAKKIGLKDENNRSHGVGVVTIDTGSKIPG